MEKLIKDKAAKKARKPTFTRADSHKKSRLGEGWRKPKGLQNKMRLHKRGYKTVVKPGYGTPSQLKHTANGKAIVAVHNEQELIAVDPKTQAALIANVGRKKKEQLITIAQEKKITIVNLAVTQYQEKTKATLKAKEDKKKAYDEKLAAQEKKAKAAEKKKAEEEQKAKEQEAAAEENAGEDKKEEEKKELDKVLTSKKGM